MSQGTVWIGYYRQAVTTWLQGLNNLNALRQQWDALDYGSSLTPEDFVGHEDITLEQLTAAVASVEAITGFVDQGHDTSLYNIVL